MLGTQRRHYWWQTVLGYKFSARIGSDYPHLIIGKQPFLVACTRLYKPLCQSVGPSVAVHEARDLWQSALSCLGKIHVHWKSGHPTIQGMSIFCSICISIYKCVTEMKTTSDLLHISCLLNVKNFLLVFLQNQNLKKATHLCRKWGGREENKAICHKSATDGQTNWQSGLCSRMHELKMQEQSLSCTHQQDSDISTTYLNNLLLNKAGYTAEVVCHLCFCPPKMRSRTDGGTDEWMEWQTNGPTDTLL